MITRILAFCAVFALTLGCNKAEEGGDKATDKAEKAATGGEKKAEGGEKAAEKKAEPEKKAPAAKAWLKIDKLGVQLEVPAGAKPMPGAGNSMMISAADGSCTVMLSKKDDTSYFPSYDSTVKTIEKGVTGKMKEMVVNEKADDENWVIHYTKASMMDPNKTQHAVDVRTKIGEGLYSCSRVTDKPEDAACILAACKSLKAI